eukprot:gene382-415_t
MTSKFLFSLTRRRFLSSKINIVQQETEVSKLLQQVVEPITRKRLSSLGCVKSVEVDKVGNVKLDLDLVIPGYPKEDEVKAVCMEKLKGLPWIGDVSIKVSTSFASNAISSDASKVNLSKVKHILGITSCKGGVGKSTVAVNLACALAQRGLKVGLLDADIYGPSLPFQLSPADPAVRRSSSNPQHILPLEAQGLPNLKMLSFGHVNPKSGAPGSGGQSAAMVRGPIATKVITQLLLATDWGELDYLLIDMPPGTGDIQITLSQLASFSGVVMVTTPHLLALVDAVKGMALMQTVDIPTLAVVENMAYFKCDHGKVYHPFGRGGQIGLLRALRTLSDGLGKKSLSHMQAELEKAPFHSLPLILPEDQGGDDHDDSSSEVEEGSVVTTPVSLPVVLALPEGEVAHLYHSISEGLLGRLFTTKVDAHMIPSFRWEEERQGLRLRYFTAARAFEYFIPASVLEVVDAETGTLPSESSSMTAASGRGTGSSSSKVLGVEAKGHYGLSVIWKHQTKIFPFDVLKMIADSLGNNNEK